MNIQTKPNDLAAFWMPFSANRQFKKAPRLFVVVSHAGGSETQVFTALADRYTQAATERFRGVVLYRLDARP